MMSDYVAEKAHNQKLAKSAGRGLFLFGLLFAAVIIRFAFSDIDNITNKELPSGIQAYRIAQQLIRNNLRAPDLNFPDANYQVAEQQDSVYVIKSFAESNINHRHERIEYSLTLKYDGGPADEKISWSIIKFRHSE